MRCATYGCEGESIITLRSHFNIPGVGQSVAFYGQCMACRLLAVAESSARSEFDAVVSNPPLPTTEPGYHRDANGSWVYS